MRAEYNYFIQAYESNNADILSIIADEFDIATEADSSTSAEINPANAVSDTVKSEESKSIEKTNLINKVIEKVKAFIKKIGEIFSSLSRKLSNRLRLMGETDKGFKKMYFKRKSMVKPYQNVRVISYKYKNSVLEQPVDKLLKDVVQCLDKLRAIEGTSNTNSRVSDIINAPQGKIIEVLLAPYIKSNDTVLSVPDFIKYLTSEYRGEKTEILYRDTQLGQIEAEALNSTAAIATKCNGYLRQAQEAYNKIKVLEYQIKRSETDTKVINLVASNAAKAATLYNAYSALLHAYYELKIEQCLNYRIILKKFYQF